MDKNDKLLDEICISYDTQSTSIAFYNVATKNRIRYNYNNYRNLLGVMKHIDSIRPVIHWPRKSHPLRTFVENLRYLNTDEVKGMQVDQKDNLLKGFWINLWRQMKAHA